MRRLFAGILLVVLVLSGCASKPNDPGPSASTTKPTLNQQTDPPTEPPTDPAPTEPPGEVLVLSDFPELPHTVKSYEGNYFAILPEVDVQKTFYVDSENGSDRNAGTSETAPVQTLKQALILASGSPSRIVIVNDNAKFFADDLYGEYLVKHSLEIVGGKNTMIIGGVEAPGWMADEGYSNVYKSIDLTSCNITNVVDVSDANRDEYGLFRPMQAVSSIEEVSSTDQSYYIENGIVYVNSSHGLENIVPMVNDFRWRMNFTLAGSDLTYSIRDLNIIGNTFMGVRSQASEEDTKTLQYFAQNCVFQHNKRGDGFSSPNFNVTYVIDCTTGYLYGDGFNYSATYLTDARKSECMIVEIGCKAEEAGYYRTPISGNDNLTTAHNGINILRIGFTGKNSAGPLVADVNGCNSVCINCAVSNDSYAYSTPASFGIYVFNSDGHRNAKVQLINCTGEDTAREAKKVYTCPDTQCRIEGGNLGS